MPNYESTHTGAEIDNHVDSVANPHGVTKVQIGLTNVTDDAQVKAVAMPDNTIPKTDGVTGQVQASGVTLDDDNAVAGAGVQKNEQTGTAYELVLADKGKVVDLDNAAAINLTIPANAAVAFPIKTVINLLASGAGQVSILITDDTLDSKDGNVKLTGQYSAATLYKKSATRWILFGDLSA